MARRAIGTAAVALVNQALALHAQRLFDEAAGRGKRAIERVEADLLGFARLLVTEVRLRKVLADPGLPPEPKRALLEDLGQGRLDQATVELLATLATLQRVPLRQLPELVGELAAMAALTAADRAGELERVGDELFALADLVAHEPQVRSALTNPGLPVANKRALVADLLEGRASDRTAALADLLVELGEGHDLDVSARELAELAARRRGLVVAEVRSAVELDDQRRARLAETLARITGSPVELRVTVDQAILGSVVVRIGDEVFDGSIRSRLEQAREALGVA
jgi:F-type H+-transporting ATPase subunit delta